MTDAKMCPYCGEDIKVEAIKCKHCHSMLSEEDNALVGAAAPARLYQATSKIKKPIWKQWWVWVAIIIILFISIGSLGGGDEAVEESSAGDATAVRSPQDAEPDLEPDPEPRPIPDHIVYSGTGDDVIKIEKPEDGPLLLYIKGNSSSRHFAVLGYDDNDNRTQLFVNTTDSYEGITLDPGGTTTMLEVNATGSWTIETRSVRSARVLETPGRISGNGDEVIQVEGAASTASVKGNPNARHFAVRGYSPMPDLMVNTTDIYEGKVRVSRGTFILEIIAVGNWEIELE